MNRDTPRDRLSGLRWIHADVFGDTPLSGNGLAVFPEAGHLSAATMLALTRELRQFEAIFLDGPAGARESTARIFTAEEELDFAGHPILGAAAAQHHLSGATGPRTRRIRVGGRAIDVALAHGEGHLTAEMDQGPAEIGPAASPENVESVLAGLGLSREHLVSDLPVVMASTGLPYVIVPLTAEGLATARIQVPDFECRLGRIGGKFVYALEPDAPEGRSWDNLGQVEDVATGSAAGPAAAYLQRFRRAPDELVVRQGRFTGRPSRIVVRRSPDTGSLLVGGTVAVVAEGRFL